MIYPGIASTSERLIKQFGQPVTLHTATFGAYDEQTATVAETITPTETTGVVFPVAEKDIDGSQVQVGDFNLLMPPQTVTVSVDDYAVIGGKKYLITKIKEISPAGIDVLLEVFIRG